MKESKVKKGSLTDNQASQKRSNTSSFQIVDNREEAVRQRVLQKMANNSLPVKRASQLQRNADQFTAGSSQDFSGTVSQMKKNPSDDSVNEAVDLEKNTYVANLKTAQLQKDNSKSVPEQEGINQNSAQPKGVKSNVTQLYSTIGKGYISGYGKGTGPAAPQFEFQHQEVDKTENPATSTTLYDMRTVQSFKDAPNIKVSANYDMAVPMAKGAESKQFFATPGIIAASNVALAAAGAPLVLAAGAGRITLPSLWSPLAGIPLTQVSPAIAPALITSSECGTFANDILGVNVHNIELLTGGGGAPVNTVIPQRNGPGGIANRDAALNLALGGHAPENIGANKHANPDVGEGFGIFARETVPPVGLMQTLWKEITTVHGLFKEKRPHMQWGEHWAGVVAKSGGDFVTLENYNRNAVAVDVLLEQLEKDYKEIDAAGGLAAFTAGTAQYISLPNEWRYQRLARLGSGYMKYGVQLGTITGFYAGQVQNMWYFAMYGSGAQSFHEQWKKSAPDAVTTKIS